METIKHFRCLEVNIFNACVSLEGPREVATTRDRFIISSKCHIQRQLQNKKETYEISLPLVWMAGKSEVSVHNLKNEL